MWYGKTGGNSILNPDLISENETWPTLTHTVLPALSLFDLINLYNFFSGIIFTGKSSSSPSRLVLAFYGKKKDLFFLSSFQFFLELSLRHVCFLLWCYVVPWFSWTLSFFLTVMALKNIILYFRLCALMLFASWILTSCELCVELFTIRKQNPLLHWVFPANTFPSP